MAGDPFFVPKAGRRAWRVKSHPSEVVRHEVLFEDQAMRIEDRPLFVGSAFSRQRFFAFAGVMLACLGLLLGRAAWMQFVKGKEYSSLAESNRLRLMPLWPRRGIVRDRQGIVLADNTPRFQVTLVPRELPIVSDELLLVVGQAARLLGVSVHDIEALASATGTARDEASLLADQVPYEQAMAFAVAMPQLPGFRLEVRPKRRYPLSKEIPSLSHVLGYVGKLSAEEYQDRRAEGYQHVDEIGKGGIERFYEQSLRGTVGERVREVDARGHWKAAIREVAARDGQDVRLSLDSELQRRAEQALRDELAAAHKSQGAVIALDPRDGSVLAAVSWPAFNNNLFSGSVSSTVYRTLLENTEQPLFPRAWAGTYPSGSTVKIVISAAALAEQIITPHTTVLSVGGIRVGPWFFPDWKPGGHGPTDVRRAIAWSVNTFFYYIGGGYESFVGLGSERLGTWMRRFGLGEKSGVDLTAEASGFVPSQAWKQATKGERWFVGDTYNLSIGQGDLLVTPLQVAGYTATIANGGALLKPHVLQSFIDVGNGQEAALPVSVRAQGFVDPGALQVVREGMRAAVTYGSARSLNTLSFPLAGKTGTAQAGGRKQTHAWFTGFAPYEQPEIVVVVLLEEGGEGSSTAVPVAREVLQKWWDLRAKRGGKF